MGKPRRVSRWASRGKELRRLVDAGLTNREIAAHYRVPESTVGEACRFLGVERAKHAAPEPMAPPPLEPIATYVEDGRTVTVYPARFAGDVETQGDVVRPRGRKGACPS